MADRRGEENDVRADEIVALVERDILYPGEVIRRRSDEADLVWLSTSLRIIEARPAPWGVAQAEGVMDAVRIYVARELDDADLTYGYVWLDDGRVVLLNDVEQLRDL